MATLVTLCAMNGTTGDIYTFHSIHGGNFLQTMASLVTFCAINGTTGDIYTFHSIL
jgi:acyl-CoA hydrolase